MTEQCIIAAIATPIALLVAFAISWWLTKDFR